MVRNTCIVIYEKMKLDVISISLNIEKFVEELHLYNEVLLVSILNFIYKQIKSRSELSKNEFVELQKEY